MAGTFSFWGFFICLCATTVADVIADPGRPAQADKRIEFVRDVQPILRKHCYECHSGEREEGGLNLAIRDRALAGGTNGTVLIKNDSSGSRLIQLVTTKNEDEFMPPSGKRLSSEEIGVLRAWIDHGMDWPAVVDQAEATDRLAREHWAFQQLQSVALPIVENNTWGRSPLDLFVLAKLEAVGCQPSPAATPSHLCRRIYFDVIGLPPSPAEMRSFCEAAERDYQNAVDELVDRLLASKNFGERWGRHWLDLARYADSAGMEGDYDRPHIWKYRDFVIRSMNDDMPYQQFAQWQLAGDEYAPDNLDAVAATGFLASGPSEKLRDDLLEEERLRQRYNDLDDMLQTIGTGMLGITLGCARCHDHKYDPITTREYYQLMSALHSGDRVEVQLGNSADKVFSYRDFGVKPKPTWLFRRADFYDRSQEVTLGFIAALTRNRTADQYLSQARQQISRNDSTYQRRALADWVTDIEHGAGALLARVIVNRVWQHHFGKPLVASVGDFGLRSERPTHPELLEFLAHDLVQHDWQLKRLHRLMLTSATFQQTSTAGMPQRGPGQAIVSASSKTSAEGNNEAQLQEIDPENRLLWKMRRQRLEAEVLRDAMLAASGTLNNQVFGAPFKPPIAAEAMLARNVKDPYPVDVKDSPDFRRRSIYMFHKRVVPLPLFQAFDKPDAQQSCGLRDQTTIAPQALALLNDPFVRSVSLEFADRLLVQSGHDVPKSIDLAFQLTLGREPSAFERIAAKEFIDSQIHSRSNRASQGLEVEVVRQSLGDFCQAIYSLNEFIYVD